MPLLEITNISAGYGDVQILHGVSLSVNDEEIVSLVGANGAGKTTLLRTISGVLPCRGEIRFAGELISRLAPHEIVGRGIAHVPEGRQLFANLTVLENLRLGAPAGLAAGELQARLDGAFKAFPRLAERRRQHAGTLSGGEQQMAAIARGLMRAPKLLMLDEPSLGLSPTMVAGIFESMTAANRAGMAILVVEQNVVESLRRSRRGYVLETGVMVADGPADQLLRDDRVRAAFLGGGGLMPSLQPIQ
jgi:branched-chain amino acid transport system ATP-binding protein